MNHLSLCSGIGGLDLAAHMAGIETTAFCEIEKYPVEVLKLRFPGKPIINDIREVDGREFRGINVISGGFPCQPHSVAGKRKGSLDERHLFPEMARIVSEAQPEWFVGENVRGIFSSKDDGGCSGGVLADSIYRLSALGYAVGWCCYGSVDIGAPHRRDRIFILANRDPEKVKKVIEIVRGSLTPWQGDCWPTPMSSDGTVGSVISKDDQFIRLPSGRLRKINRNGTDGSPGLARTVMLTSNPWPTPRANDSEKRGNIANDPKNGLPGSALWNTPKSQDSNDKSLPPSSLRRASLPGDLARQKETWNTPTASDYKNASLPESRIHKSSLVGDLARLEELWSTPVSSLRGGVRSDFQKPLNIQAAELSGKKDLVEYRGNYILSKAKMNPDWVALLMGFPVGWASLGECEDYFRGWPAGCGPYQYEYEPPRLIEGCDNLAKQLKGYGNAVNPYQGRPIFRAIREVSG